MRILKIEEMAELLETSTSATGGPAVSGGMGAVVSAQPSGIPGVTLGPNWASHGGTTGSGDIGVPYNPSGNNRNFFFVPGYKRTTGEPFENKKKKKSNFKKISQMKPKKKKQEKIMDFQEYIKNDINKIKK